MTVFLIFLIIGVALLAAELVVFQFSVFWFFFIGIGALIAAAWAWIIPDVGLTSTIAVFVIASAGITAALLAPLKTWQSKPTGLEDNNALGQQVQVITRIAPGEPGKVQWSGSEWTAELSAGLDVILESGSPARVVRVEGITLYIAPQS